MRYMLIKILLWPSMVYGAAHHIVEIDAVDPHALTISPAIENIASRTIEELADVMILSYFRGNGEKVRNHIRPFIIEKIKTRRHSVIHRLTESLEDSDDSEPSQDIQALVSEAVEAAMLEQQRNMETQHHDAECRIRAAKDELPTVKVALITAGASIIAAAITAGVTVAISFT